MNTCNICPPFEIYHLILILIHTYPLQSVPYAHRRNNDYESTEVEELEDVEEGDDMMEREESEDERDEEERSSRREERKEGEGVEIPVTF